MDACDGEGGLEVNLCGDILRPSESNPNSMLIYDLFATIQNEVKIIRAFIPARERLVRAVYK